MTDRAPSDVRPTDPRAWIRTSERLPPYGETVIATYKRRNGAGNWVSVFELRSTDCHGHHWWFSTGREVESAVWEITHWLPLPEAAT